MKEIKYSFIVAVYNVGPYIEQCIKSIIDQTYQNIELILVNDGSTDDSLEICERFASIDDRIKVINQKNQGVSVARNNGLEIAEGEWICFVDGDDWVEPSMCAKLNQYCEDSALDVCLFSYYDAFPKKLKSYKLENIDVLNFDKNDFEVFQKASLNQDIKSKYNFKKIRLVTPWAKIYSHEFIKKYGFKFNAKLKTGEDNLFNLDVYEKARKGMYINEELYFHRVCEGAVSKRYNTETIDSFTNLLDAMATWMEKNKKRLELNEEYNVRVLLSLEYCMLLDLCHKNNDKSYAENRDVFKKIINREPFKTALDKTKFNQVSFRKQIFMRVLKTRSFLLTYLLIKLNELYENIAHGTITWSKK